MNKWRNDGLNPDQKPEALRDVTRAKDFIGGTVYKLYVLHVESDNGKGFKFMWSIQEGTTTGDLFLGTGMAAYKLALAQGQRSVKRAKDFWRAVKNTTLW